MLITSVQHPGFWNTVIAVYHHDLKKREKMKQGWIRKLFMELLMVSHLYKKLIGIGTIPWTSRKQPFLNFQEPSCWICLKGFSLFVERPFCEIVTKTNFMLSRRQVLAYQIRLGRYQCC